MSAGSFCRSPSIFYPGGPIAFAITGCSPAPPARPISRAPESGSSHRRRRWRTPRRAQDHVGTAGIAASPSPAMPLLRRPHDHRRDLRARRRTRGPPRPECRGQDRDAMTPVTVSSHPTPAGKLHFPRQPYSYCLSAAKGACGDNDHAKTPRQCPAQRQNPHPDRRSTANHRGLTSPSPRRRPDKSP